MDLSAEGFRSALREFIARHGSGASAARALGVGPEYLRQIVTGQRPPSEAVLKGMGFEKVTVYRQVSE